MMIETIEKIFHCLVIEKQTDFAYGFELIVLPFDFGDVSVKMFDQYPATFHGVLDIDHELTAAGPNGRTLLGPVLNLTEGCSNSPKVSCEEGDIEL